MPKDSDLKFEVRNGALDRRRESNFAERVGRELTSAADLLARFNRGKLESVKPAAAAMRRNWDVDSLAATIAQSAAKFLGSEQLDPNADFFDRGGTSANAVELLSQLSRELGVQISLDDLFADARPRRLAERFLGGAGNLLSAVASPPGVIASEPRAEVPSVRPVPAPLPEPGGERSPNVHEDLRAIEADLELAASLPWVGPPEYVTPRRILLTGATGFLGSQMLFDLLRRSEAHVVCLVRGENVDKATERLRAACTAADLPWSSELERRITVLPGDIQEPLLGLSRERWNALTIEVDAIVNVAAAVDFMRGYQSLRRANVLGPLTLAQLATTGRIKSLHQVSTVSIFDELGIRSMNEDDPPPRADRLFAGYETTKWAAEAILRRARERGLVVSNYRPGGIVSHTVTGVYNPHDLSNGFMASWQMMRLAPEFRSMHVAPVDWVSRITVEMVLDPSSWGHNYHLTGKALRLRETVRDMAFAGVNLRVLGFDQWREEFLARMQSDPIPSLEFMVRVLHSPVALHLIRATLDAPPAGTERTDEFIRRHKLPQCPAPNVRTLISSSERLIRDGRLALPGREAVPYLQFRESMEGTLAALAGGEAAECSSRLKLSIASFYQLFKERRIDVHGEIRCALLHAQPLQVETGDCWVRPDDGVPHKHGLDHPLLRYSLTLRDADGKRYWLEGQKSTRPGRDQWAQGRTLRVEIGLIDQPASLRGQLVVPADSYVPEQIDGIELSPDTPPQQRGLAKLFWLAWFGGQFGLAFSEPLLRRAGELVDAGLGIERKVERR